MVLGRVGEGMVISMPLCVLVTVDGGLSEYHRSGLVLQSGFYFSLVVPIDQELPVG